MKKILSIGLVLAFGVSHHAAAQFSDSVNIPSWGKAAVTELYEAQIVSGNDDGSLAPWRTINRAEFLKILTTATNVDISSSTTKSFPDVPNDAWFSPYVQTAVQLGWAEGYPDGYFRPGNTINRAEIAKLLSEAWDLSLELDASDTQWFEIYVRALEKHQHLPQNTTLNAFAPATNPTRIEVFEQLHGLWFETATAEAVIPAVIETPTPSTRPRPATETQTETSEETAPTKTETENLEILGVNEENNTESQESSESETVIEETTPTPETENNGEGGTEEENGGETGTETEPETETESQTSENSETSSENNSQSESSPEPETEPETEPEPEPEPISFRIESINVSENQIIYPGQGGITGFSFQLIPVDGTPTLKSLTFSLSGTLAASNFSRMWLYDDNERISDEIIPSSNNNTIEFVPVLTLSEAKNVYLKLDTPSDAIPGGSARWSILSVDTTESDASVVETNFPIPGQLMEMHPE